jgi:NAD(P)-dependent dehydrogenase (short-subunit alcohol dehydrogenase family)
MVFVAEGTSSQQDVSQRNLERTMRTVIITGANSGIGFAAAKHLAGFLNWHVVLACRDASKASSAISAIKEKYQEARLSFAHLDLFSLASVRLFPKILAAKRLPCVGGLILNAGGPNIKSSPEFTEDGFEKAFQLNFLGHFLLTNLLIREMNADARVIFVSSDLHDPDATRMGKIMGPKFGPVEDLARATASASKLKPLARYATAKLYTMMTAYELDRRLRQAGHSLTVNCWSPGVVPTTAAGRGMNPLMKRLITSNWFVNFMGSHLSTEEEAARDVSDLLVSPKYSGVSGKYFDGSQQIASSVESRDPIKAQTVWEQSQRLVGISREEPSLAPTRAISEPHTSASTAE